MNDLAQKKHVLTLALKGRWPADISAATGLPVLQVREIVKKAREHDRVFFHALAEWREFWK